ncbi:hypothetical protein KTU01_19980 [Kocuria turfanensis]|uniref:Integrase n=2 Tax=Kocuria turfanensis TaxID=388357 RepID=A0A512IDU9_9MICC|nr:hypothetical protein KTU01_19980 [Kocuria turfanensis]
MPVMELSIGLPDGLLMRLTEGNALRLFEKDHETVRRTVDCSVLGGAPITDLVWSHKLSAVIVAVPSLHRLFRWDPYTDVLYGFAGTGEPGRRDGEAGQATFAATVSITEDGNGTLWFVDRDSSSLRCIEIDTDKPDGDPRVCTVVGRAGPGFADGPADVAQLDHPEDLQILYDGSIVIADTGNDAIRHLDLADRELDTVYGGAEAGAAEFDDEIRLQRPVRVTVADSELWVDDDNGRHRLELHFV